MFQIKDYRPKFYSNCKDFMQKNHKLIHQLIGQNFEGVYWVWDKTNEIWIKEFPVILKLSGGYCTLCAHKHSDFSMGFNNIDLNEKIKSAKYAGSELVWKEYNTRLINKSKNKDIQAVEIVNFLPRFINDFPLYNKKEENIIRKLGFLHGVGFNIDGKTMVISNGLDDNNIVFFDMDFPVYYTRIIINK